MSFDSGQFDDRDEGDRRGEMFAVYGLIFVMILWTVGLSWNFRDYLDLCKLKAPENWGYWLATVGTFLGAAASSSRLGTKPGPSLRDTASLLGWVLLFISSVLPLAVIALRIK